MSYLQPEAGLDYDEATAFLATLADTVPSIDKSLDWNRDLDYNQQYNPAFEARFEARFEAKYEPSSPEVISLNGLIDDVFAGSSNESDLSVQSSGNSCASNPSNFYDYNTMKEAVYEPVYSNRDETTSYTNLLGLTMSPHAELSPTSCGSSVNLLNKWPGGQVNYSPTDANPNFGYNPMEHIAEFCPEMDFEPSPSTEAGGSVGSGNEWNLHYETKVKVEENDDNAFFGDLPDHSPNVDISPQLAKAKVRKPLRKTKTSHNVIEKKYRTSINSKIMELREAVPTLRFATGKQRVSIADLDGLSPACKLNKASILTKANEYIIHMKRKNKALQRDILALQEMVSRAEANLQNAPSTQYPRSNHVSMPSYLTQFTSLEAPAHVYQRRTIQESPLLPGGDILARGYPMYSNGYMNAGGNVPIQPAPQHQAPGNRNTNLFMGGMVTLMGASYINDNNFQAMSAMPFFPTSIAVTSESVVQLIYTLRMCTIFFGASMLVYSIIGSAMFRPKSPKRHLLEPLSWILSTIGVKPRGSLSDVEKHQVMKYLMGSETASEFQWFKAYLGLRTKNPTFECLLLQFLVGAVIMKQKSSFSKVVEFDLKWKRRAFMKTEYIGDDELLTKLSSLIHSVDGLLMFASDCFSQRLFNLSHNKPICQNISNGENALLFAESLLRNEKNLYGVLFEWRVLEIIHELTLVYLDLLVSPADAQDDALEDLKKDTWKLAELVNGSNSLSRQLSYFELLLFPGAAPDVLKSDKQFITNTLKNFTHLFEEPELTDDEYISDDDEEGDDDDEHDSSSLHRVDSTVSSTGPENDDSLLLIKKQKSAVRSLNLMSEEKFIVLLTSLINYYAESDNQEKLLQLLNHLRLREDKVQMSLLSFTCLLKLISSLVKTDAEEADATSEDSVAVITPEMAENMSSTNCLVLESVVNAMRGWLNDDSRHVFLPSRLRNDLSSVVVSKGIAINKL